MKLVLDNNIFFSLMNPKSVDSYLFSSLRFNFASPEFVKSESETHKEECLVKSRLSKHEFEIRQKDVESEIEFISFSEYKESFRKAVNALPDPKDAPYLATALLINAPIWSNDPHLKQQSLVKVFTTSELIEMFLRREI